MEADAQADSGADSGAAMTAQDAGRRGEEIKAALKKVGARNDPFARCSLCKKDWNGGEGHEHEADHAEAERDGDFLFIREEKGGRIWTDYDGMAKWVAAHVDAAVAEAVRGRDAYWRKWIDEYNRTLQAKIKEPKA